MSHAYETEDHDCQEPVAKPGRKIVRVALCVPNEGHTLPEAYDNRIQMGFHMGALQIASHLGIKEYDGFKYDYPDNVEFKFHWMSVGRVLTPLARERLTEFALEAKVDYMLHVDDDMICPPDLFEKLYKHQVDIVAPLAFMRIPPHEPVMFRVDQGWDPVKKMEYFYTTRVKNYPKNKLVECDAVGFGAALIKMDVVRRMSKPYFMSTQSAGEDCLFCYNAKKVGARVFMDTGLQIGHLGIPQVIWEEDFEREAKNDDLRHTYGDWKGKEAELTRAA